MQITRALIALSLTMAATTVYASPVDREGAYAYAGLGQVQSSWSIPAGDVVAGVKRKQSTSGAGYVAGAGYRFSPHLAAEASFENTLSNSRSSHPTTAVFTHRSFTVGGVALLPIGERVELFGKVAVGSRQQKLLPSTAVDAKPTRQNKFATTPSVGANVYLTEALALRAEYSLPMTANTKVREAAGVEKLRFSTWNLGVGYRF